MTEETKATQTVDNTTETTQEVVTEEVATEEVATEEVAESNPLEHVQVNVYNVGDSVKGTVVRLMDKAALVELETKYTGVIPVSEIANVYYENIADAIKVGDIVECKVKTIDEGKDTLILSKKDFDKENAWTRIVALAASDEPFDVVVTGPVKGGLVVDLGVRGFIPAKHVDTSFVDDLSVFKGQTFSVKIIELDEENKKVVLSRRVVLEQIKAEETKEFIRTLEVGQEFTGTVQRIANFGAFVNIGPVDGMVHISQLSWDHVEKPEDVVKEGEVVKVQIIKIDADIPKISLSMKTMLPQPWDTIAEKFKEGEIVPGTVKRITEFGVFVEIAPGIEGLVRISQLSHSFVKSPYEVVKVGQEIQVKILQLDTENKKAGLSLKETLDKPVDGGYESQADQADIEANTKQQQLTTNLGEQFGELLSKFKK